VKEPKLFLLSRGGFQTYFLWFYNVETRNEMDRSSVWQEIIQGSHSCNSLGKDSSRVLTRDNPREPLLLKRLGNLLGSIRLQKHHLIETRRPRTPLELPHSRYRTRVYSRGMMDTEINHRH